MRLVAQHPEWVLGFEEETWWSRLAYPNLHSWTDAQPLRLVENARPKEDATPKALAGYGLLLRGVDFTERGWLRFVTGRPVSALTIHYLEWACAKLERWQKRALILIWDNASWHQSQRVREWLRTHHREVKTHAHGVRLVVCALPTKSPWLNPIEPMWIHGKRRVVEAQRVLPPAELMARVYAAFNCEPEPCLAISKNVP